MYPQNGCKRMSELLSENRYSETLLIEWLVIPIAESEETQARYDVYLTMHIGHQEEPLGEGGFTWGLKGGTLGLKLKGAHWRELGEPRLDWSGIQAKAIATVTSEYLTWQLLPLTLGQGLHGELTRGYLGTIYTDSPQAIVEMTFMVKGSEVRIIRTEGLWKHQMTPNQGAIAEHSLALILAASKLQPYLSRMVWQPAGEPQMPPPYEPKFNTTHALEIIEKISRANTDNFQELCHLAGLNPTEDLAGAKLLGAHLNGVDLSGANLSQVYLRGAELCDIDLSNAHLENAHFGGADLSGAYLSDAQLTGANFHRASLALANLSGANLINADFTDANLNKANLSNTQLTGANFTGAELTSAGILFADLTAVIFEGAKVDQARFKDNPGLTETVREKLLAGGAIFEIVDT